MHTWKTFYPAIKRKKRGETTKEMDQSSYFWREKPWTKPPTRKFQIPPSSLLRRVLWIKFKSRPLLSKFLHTKSRIRWNTTLFWLKLLKLTEEQYTPLTNLKLNTPNFLSSTNPSSITTCPSQRRKYLGQNLLVSSISVCFNSRNIWTKLTERSSPCSRNSCNK